MFYEIEIKIEELKDDGDYAYMATSPDLPGLIVAGDSVEEVMELAPQIASSLIASMKASGDPLPDNLHVIQSFPHTSQIAVAV